MRLSLVPPLALTALVVGTPTSRVAEPPVLAPNANTAPAGTLRGGVLTLDLEATRARWHREGGAVPGTLVDAFAEAGKSPLIPGPLIRVPAGTEIRMRVHNALSKQITFFLPTSPSADDSIMLAPGATGEIRGRASRPGNYIYRATDTTKAAAQLRMDGALGGAIVVDSAGVTPRRDRVFMILMVPDSTLVAVTDTIDMFSATKGRLSFTINGRSWPNTERITATVGDTARWRVINGSADIHPMHLHGFYYRVDELTGLLVARQGQGQPGRMVVTERLSDFSAMSMTWVPPRPGNWLFHCHFALHLMPPAPDSGDPMPADHANPALTGMVGLVLGIIVAPRPGTPVVVEKPAARRIRLVAVRDSQFPDSAPSMRFVIEENGHRTSAWPTFSPTLYLTRNQPVSIMVVNHLPERTSVHWHGMELTSYYDGVAGFSGSANRLSPVIAPGDSFEARFTPPRAGTFMYHSHMDDVRQQTAGLLGAMIVRDGPPGPRPDDHEIFLKGARDVLVGGKNPLEVNGMVNPDTIVIHAGREARFRLMSLALVNPNATVTLTARRDSSFANLDDQMLVRWRPVAKDGADLPAGQAPRPARQIISMGETYDFAYTPERRGALRIEVRGGGPGGVLLARVPVKIE